MFIDIFESAENQQYFVDDDKLVWLHGTLLAEKLGFKNVSQAIQMHTEEDERQQIALNGRLVWFVSEYGVWGLILASKTPEALLFKRKLKREILPKLRASGYYIDHAAIATSEEKKAALLEEVDLLRNGLGHTLIWFGNEKMSCSSFLNRVRLTHADQFISFKHGVKSPSGKTKHLRENFLYEYRNLVIYGNDPDYEIYDQMLEKLGINRMCVQAFENDSSYSIWLMYWFLEKIFSKRYPVYYEELHDLYQLPKALQ